MSVLQVSAVHSVASGSPKRTGEANPAWSVSDDEAGGEEEEDDDDDEDDKQSSDACPQSTSAGTATVDKPGTVEKRKGLQLQCCMCGCSPDKVAAVEQIPTQ